MLAHHLVPPLHRSGKHDKLIFRVPHIAAITGTNVQHQLVSSSSVSPVSNSVSSNTTSTTKEQQPSTVHDEYWKPPPGMVKMPWYRRHYSEHQPNWLQKEQIGPADMSLAGYRLNDYYKMQQIVNQLPTVKDKIDFINPYEREWKQSEKTWHRPWMKPLVASRKAWAIPPIPPYFDSLNFYKYIAKCRLVDGQEASSKLNDYYKELSLPTTKFEERVAESLALLLDKQAAAKLETHTSDEERDKIERAKFLRSLVEDAHMVLVHGNQRLVDHRISYNPRCESFWIRAGFSSLYDYLPVWETEAGAAEEKAKNEIPFDFPKRKPRFVGDDRRRLGELGFTMRDEHAIQVRTINPLKSLYDFSDLECLHAPLFRPDVDVTSEVIFSPKVYNLFADSEILWQCPGYDYDSDETHKYGKLAVKDITPLIKKLEQHWRYDSQAERDQMLNECVQATAIISLFNWLNGQAHCLGSTQYTEIQCPMVSQMVLTDNCQNFWFAVAQLNTIAINIDVEDFNNFRTNCCYVEGPYRLYDVYIPPLGSHKFQTSKANNSRRVGIKMQTGLNQFVLQRLLQMCVI